MQVTAGLLSPGTTYYWTATATGSVEGHIGLKTLNSAAYRFTTSAKYSSANEPAAKIQFESLGTAGYVEAFASIMSENGPQVTEAFFKQAAMDPAAIQLPGLVEQSDATKKQVFAISADAAANNSPIKESDLPMEVQSTQAEQPEISTFSVSSAPVAGVAAHDRRTWIFDHKVVRVECSWFSCRTVAWITTTYTTDPGQYRSKTGLKFKKWGNYFGSVSITSSILAAGSNVSVTGWVLWNAPGSGVQYNSHTSTLNKSFQAWYQIKVGTPNGPWLREFKTKKSAACKNPSVGAYQCLF